MPFHIIDDEAAPSHQALCWECGGARPYALVKTAERDVRDAVRAGLLQPKAVTDCECELRCVCE